MRCEPSYGATIESEKGLMGHLMLYPVKELEAFSGEETLCILQAKSSPVLVVIYARVIPWRSTLSLRVSVLHMCK